ncbi:GspS/AspS pilotin family protein [Vibrio gallicus]|uniref:GspS/AspS pilotin family protein n=1 Tax=Vibrio gallicus TaxID=190897 RepID=UPI0021C34537|nr:GspS/AspS pilotin family protein [Vibrio gallicus]
MTINFKKLLLVLFAGSLIAGCASSDEKQKALELKADRRADILASSLPITYGPLTIASAKSKNSTVIIEMLYNQSGNKPANQLIDSAATYYCSSKEVRASMDEGVNYAIKIRNNRGQLVVEKVITSDSCKVQPDSN